MVNVKIELLSSFWMGLKPTYCYGNEQGSGVGKSYNCFYIVRLIRKNNHPLPYWSFFFFSYITSVFYNMQGVSFRMAMTTSILMLSWHLLLPLLFSKSTSSFHIGGYGCFCPYSITFHFRHNDFLCFVTDDYIPVQIFLSHIFLLWLFLDSTSSIMELTSSTFPTYIFLLGIVHSLKYD